MKCHICGKNSETEYCFKHKPRKALRASRTPLKTKKVNDEVQISQMRQLFLSVWSKRVHNCENCGRWLGKEPFSYMFDHILEKSKYPELKFEENNISLLCLECHDEKTRGIVSEKYQEKINQTKMRYEIDY